MRLAGLLAALAMHSSTLAAAVPAKEQDKMTPMTVTIVRHADSECSVLCAEWLQAEGDITQATPAAFRKIFDQIGSRDLPILIHSPGGSVEAAMEIGRMLRKRHARIMVAATDYVGCRPTDAACRKLKPADGYRGRPTYGWGYCASSCSLLIAGAEKRAAPFGVVVGVHQVTTTQQFLQRQYRVHYREEGGRRVEVGREIIRETIVTGKTVSPGLKAGVYDAMRTYFRTMGISEAIIDIGYTAPHDRIRVLTQDEMNSLNLATLTAAAIGMTAPDREGGIWTPTLPAISSRTATPRPERIINPALRHWAAAMVRPPLPTGAIQLASLPSPAVVPDAGQGIEAVSQDGVTLRRAIGVYDGARVIATVTFGKNIHKNTVDATLRPVFSDARPVPGNCRMSLLRKGVPLIDSPCNSPNTILDPAAWFCALGDWQDIDLRVYGDGGSPQKRLDLSVNGVSFTPFRDQIDHLCDVALQGMEASKPKVAIVAPAAVPSQVGEPAAAPPSMSLAREAWRTAAITPPTKIASVALEEDQFAQVTIGLSYPGDPPAQAQIRFHGIGRADKVGWAIALTDDEAGRLALDDCEFTYGWSGRNVIASGCGRGRFTGTLALTDFCALYSRNTLWLSLKGRDPPNDRTYALQKQTNDLPFDDHGLTAACR